MFSLNDRQTLQNSMEGRTPKQYIIDLDLPPNQRWTQLFNDHKQQCLNAVKELDKIVSGSMLGRIVAFTAENIAYLYGMAGRALYIEEIRANAELMGISVGKAILFQLVYEMSAMCTSIGSTVNGEMIHYRTMDWDMQFLKDLTVSLEFTRKGKTLFHAVSWVGYIGILTAMVPGKYSLSINFRQTGTSLLSNVTRLMAEYYPIGYLCREILESDYSVDEAINRLKTEELVAPCYITICRPDSVMVIARDRSAIANLRLSNSHCIQTNRDYGQVGGENILYSLERYELADKVISTFKGDKYEDLVKVLSVKPIINEETIYITVMIPSTGTIKTIIV